MRSRRRWSSRAALPLAVAVLGLSSALSGCDQRAEEADTAVVGAYVDIPSGQQEIVTVSPSREHVWVPGYWEREAGAWTWSKGRWDKPPHDKAHWLRGHWSHQTSGWRWVRGHWAVGDTDWVVTDILDVPRVLPEIRPPAPSAGDHWVAGHWDWDAGWHWIPGYYTTKPDPKAYWVPGRWIPHASGGYWWLGGHWQTR